MQHFTQYYLSPVGRLEITATNSALLSIHFAVAQKKPGPGRPQTPENSLPIEQCIRELDEYFAGKRQVFSVPYVLQGTLFSKKLGKPLPVFPTGRRPPTDSRPSGLVIPKRPEPWGCAMAAIPW